MSACNESLRSLFVHVPKTGGCSLSSFAWNKGNGHDTVADFQARLGPRFADFFSWAFVRNPWERAASAYEDCPEIWPAAPTFADFVDTIHRHRKDLDGVKQARFSSTFKLGLPVGRIHFLPQILCLANEAGEVAVSFVGRFEKMASDLAAVQTCLGVPVEPPPHHNARKNKPNRRTTPLAELYEKPETVEKVGEFYAADVRAFGYSFEVR